MPTSYPIILAHGICPFDKIIRPFSELDNLEDDRLHYFRKIRTILRQNGFVAFHSRVSWAASIERRASDLKKEITRITENFSKWTRVHIIAHSMGGLDARQMIHEYQMEDQVASLTTIGTPHLGTAFADWGVKKFGIFLDMVRPFGLNFDGFKQLTRESCQTFNKKTRDFEKQNGVLYQTVAGVQPLNMIFWPLRYSYRIIWREEGENDGLVSLESAAWKDEYLLEVLDADHFDQIGWWDGSKRAWLGREAFERRIHQFYLRISSGLKD